MNTTERYRELDALRGIAVLLMIAYHAAFDLTYYYGWNINVMSGGWKVMQITTAALFLLLIGICFSISWYRRLLLIKTNYNGSRYWVQTVEFAQRYKTYLDRAAIIFVGGMLITLLTWFISPEYYVQFGILHLIGISVLLQPFFARFGWMNIALGLLWITFGIELGQITITDPTLFPVGITTASFASLDYYPLFPWFGIILIGMGIGSTLYVPEPKKSIRMLQHISNPLLPNPIINIGKSALIIYFIHQPLLLILFSAILA